MFFFLIRLCKTWNFVMNEACLVIHRVPLLRIQNYMLKNEILFFHLFKKRRRKGKEKRETSWETEPPGDRRVSVLYKAMWQLQTRCWKDSWCFTKAPPLPKSQKNQPPHSQCKDHQKWHHKRDAWRRKHARVQVTRFEWFLLLGNWDRNLCLVFFICLLGQSSLRSCILLFNTVFILH